MTDFQEENIHLDAVRECYHVARLALFNTRLLNSLEGSPDAEVRQLIDSEIESNGLRPPVSLLHQATFLSMAYICLVWLTEAMRKHLGQDNFDCDLEGAFRRRGVELPSRDRIEGPRELRDWPAVLRLVRNALSHGNVEIADGYFEFTVSVRARGVISGVGDGVFRGGACPTPECGVAGGHRVHRYGGVCTLQP